MKRVILFFILALFVGATVNIGQDLLSTGDRISLTAGEPDVEGDVEVIDCRNSSFQCSDVEIEKRLSGCSDSWRPWDSLSEFNCSYTEQSLDSVTLISDAANYVDIPRLDTDHRVEVLEETGSSPWDLEFLPSGRRIWTNKGGGIHWEVEGGSEQISSLEVVNMGENGLLGLAVDPEFRDNRYIYLYYSFNVSDRETLLDGEYVVEQRVSRFRLVNGSLVSEEVLLEVPGSRYHSGGRLEFGPDGKLYVTTGEAYMEYRTVDPDYLAGKTLRINRDGSVPEDNPFEGSPTYSRGHRNPQGLAWHPETGNLYSTEHGPWRYDELNRIEPGGQYGWVYYKCDKHYRKSISYGKGILDRSRYNGSVMPVHCWKNYTIAPSGMTFVDDPGHPWHGDLFVAGLRGKHIARFDIEDGEVRDQRVFYVSDDEPGISLRLRDVEYREGSLYVIGDKSGMVRLTPR